MDKKGFLSISRITFSLEAKRPTTLETVIKNIDNKCNITHADVKKVE